MLLFTHPQVVPNLYEFLSYGGNETVDGSLAIDFHSIVIHIIEINGYRQYLVTNILQNIFFCAQKKKETHTGLVQCGGKQMMADFTFLGELYL